ncbi:MAG: hypothetical protein GY769_08695 [bacterium]|nr:hypothetical protein [bacterium]
MKDRLSEYLRDPFLRRLWREVRRAGPLRSISVDLTHACNIRCDGCYFFEEGMDGFRAPQDERLFDAFIEGETARGTNFVTVVGGEPSLMLNRLRKIYDNFWMNVATNGLRKIPVDGFENMPIGVSVWGNAQTDRRLRGGGKLDVFRAALDNYRDDPRAFFYYTVTPAGAHEIPEVVTRCVENGNRVLFNFYGEVTADCAVEADFGDAQREIENAIARYPERILITSYLSGVVTAGELYGQQWGWEVCTSVSADNEVNRWRLANGNPYNSHFRAYNADLNSTRRCCTGVDRDCSNCFDVWERFSWVMINLRKHLGSKREFTCWLTVMYMFYLINRIVDYEEGIELLPEIHRRVPSFLDPGWPSALANGGRLAESPAAGGSLTTT